MNPTWRFGTTCVLLGSTFVASRVATLRGSQSLAQPLAAIDRQLGDWSATDDPPLAARIAESLAATSYLSRTYRHGSRSVNLFIAYYANQRAGETMHSPKYCIPGGGWEMMDSAGATVTLEGVRVPVNNYLLLKAGERLRMLYWYQGRDRVIASEYLGKVFLVWDALRRGQTSGSIVRVTLPDGPEAVDEGLEFSAQVIPQVARCFGK
jgi:EpsI family protein